MKPQSKYSEKLLDPRWQKKRLEIMQRDDFTCQFCGDKESTLNVHHKKYYSNKDPWDYDQSDLVTLCEGCHECELNRKENEQALINVLQLCNMSSSSINAIVCDLYELTQPDPVPDRDVCVDRICACFRDHFKSWRKHGMD